MNLPGQKIRKVKTVGIGRGWGASAFFFKQVKEMHRHSPLVFWGGSTIMLAAVGAFISIVMMNSGDDGEPMSSSLIMMVATITSISVSYTHLDVYKRQIVRNAQYSSESKKRKVFAIFFAKKC